MRGLPLLALLVVLGTPALAQAPSTRDTTQKDSARVTLPDLEVTVRRTPETVVRIPAAVSVVGRREIQGAQSTLGLDESLNNMPGVYVANRYNANLDQRLVIRGSGARANFGIRGIKIVLDGIPQTLPDGQSQLSNVDFGNLQRIEVLRGAASSLYGNASGGVVSLTSEGAGASRFSQSVRAEAGSFGLFKIQGRTTARSGPASGVLSLSRTQADGFRQHSASEFTQLNLGGDYVLGSTTSLGLRFGYSNAPKAQNPGALTAAEVLANPDSAAAANIARNADKDVSQGQLGLTVRHYTRHGEINATVFGLIRNLESPAATPPRSGAPFNQGIWQSIDRKAGGFRVTADQGFGSAGTGLRVTAGLDLQRMQDDRTTYLTIAGVRDTVSLAQLETVTEVGPFVQLHWSPAADVVLSAGGRYDAVKFDVADKHFSDGTDNSGDRTMSSVSGNAGVSVIKDRRFSPYLNISTSFETPTTTELANQPNSTGGFNTGLQPQRSVNYEVGARGTVGRLTYSVAGFLGRVKNAIVQYREVSGRGYFANAGRLKNDGIELGLNARVLDRLSLFGNWTYANDRYDVYRSVNGATIDTLDGNRLPGVPKAFIRFGLRAGPVRGVALDVDHTMASSIFADDRNTTIVNGWGKAAPGTINGIGLGVTNARISWEGRSGGAWLRPFIGVNNLWDRKYVSALTLNATFGRVFETAPGRNWYVGGEIGWAAQ